MAERLNILETMIQEQNLQVQRSNDTVSNLSCKNIELENELNKLRKDKLEGDSKLGLLAKEVNI